VKNQNNLEAPSTVPHETVRGQETRLSAEDLVAITDGFAQANDDSCRNYKYSQETLYLFGISLRSPIPRSEGLWSPSIRPEGAYYLPQLAGLPLSKHWRRMPDA